MSKESRQQAREARKRERATVRRKAQQAQGRIIEGRRKAPQENDPDDEPAVQIHRHGR